MASVALEWLTRTKPVGMLLGAGGGVAPVAPV